MDSRRLWAATGIMTFSSKLPDCPAMAMVVSLPMTCAQTMVADSAMTGLTLPGMMEDPGWTSGSAISPIPARGPDPSQRRSLHIFIRLTATVLSAPGCADYGVDGALRLEVVVGFGEGDVGSFSEFGDDAFGEFGMHTDAGADGGAAKRKGWLVRQGRVGRGRVRIRVVRRSLGTLVRVGWVWHLGGECDRF